MIGKILNAIVKFNNEIVDVSTCLLLRGAMRHTTESYFIELSLATFKSRV